MERDRLITQYSATAVSIYENGWGGGELQEGLPEWGPSNTPNKSLNYKFLTEFRSLLFLLFGKTNETRTAELLKKCIENMQNIYKSIPR